MKFNQTYYHSMDQGFYSAQADGMDGLEITPDPKEPETDFNPSQFGFGSNPFQRPIQAVNARIRQGVGYIDIPFFGAGKGQKDRYTPESIGSKERRDIKELAEINKVKMSTHASTTIHGLAGLQQNAFDENAREKTLKEIKKAIDFASDIQGGAVVFHTGEWPRPFSEQKWNRDKMFVNYPEEENRAVLHMVDDRTGEIIGSARKSQTVHEPVWKTADHNYIDSQGNQVRKGDFIDEEDNRIDKSDRKQLIRRVPEWDNEAEAFKTIKLTWDDFKERAEKSGLEPEEEFFRAQTEEGILQARGQSLFYSQYYERYQAEKDAVKEALEFYEKLDESMPEEEKWRLMKQDPRIGMAQLGLVKAPEKPIVDILRDKLTETERSLKHVHEASAAADVRADDIEERWQHIKTVADYGMDKSADTIARAAQFAHAKTEQKKKGNPMFRDIYVSPESWMPEMYGSHPNEISELIDKSRDRFVELMSNKGMSEHQAKDLAKNHIKGTLDVGHFNMWRQHFKGSDEEFNKWYLGKVKSLVESGKVGQVHITDNMGFDDEHLTPGEGNIPMKEVMKIVEDAGIKDVVVEAGSFNPTEIVPDTFSYFGSPVYGVSRGGPSFSQIHQQAFGYNAPPFYIVGAYAPSNEWSLWSEVQLE